MSRKKSPSRTDKIASKNKAKAKDHLKRGKRYSHEDAPKDSRRGGTNISCRCHGKV